MSEQREVLILSGVRTAIGDYGGSLKDIPPSDLAARVVKEAVSRAKIDPADVGQCVIGNVIHTEPRDMYISRLACVNGGLPHDTGALTLNTCRATGASAASRRASIASFSSAEKRRVPVAPGWARVPRPRHRAARSASCGSTSTAA